MRRYANKSFFSVLLLAAFMLPQGIQYHHVLTVFHTTNSCSHSCENNLHPSEEACPLHDYIFAVPHKVELPFSIEASNSFLFLIFENYTDKIQSVYGFSYRLRAPPLINSIF